MLNTVFGRISWRILRRTWSNSLKAFATAGDVPCPLPTYLGTRLTSDLRQGSPVYEWSSLFSRHTGRLRCCQTAHEPTVGTGACEVNELTGCAYELSQQELWCGERKVRITYLRPRQLSYYSQYDSDCLACTFPTWPPTTPTGLWYRSELLTGIPRGPAMPSLRTCWPVPMCRLDPLC